MKLRDEYRITLYVVGGCFVLSMLIGFIRGNPGGIVLMRAFLSALLFGVIFQGGIIIIRKYIPELSGVNQGNGGEKSAEETAEEAGAVIDYRVGEEDNPDMQVTSVGADDSDIGQGVLGSVLKGEEEHPMSDEVSPDMESASIPDGVELGELPALESLFEDEEKGAEENRETVNPQRSQIPIPADYIQIGDAHFPYEPKALAKAVKKVMKDNGTK